MNVINPGSCPHRLAWRNPLGSADIHIDCSKPEHADGEHQGKLINTVVTWQTGDRRDFTGEFPGWCRTTPGCVLPAMHGGGCAT